MEEQLKAGLEAILEEKNTKLLPENIKAGVTILGVTGELVNEGLDTSDATLGASVDMIKGRIAYGKDGRRIVGTLTDYRSTDELPGNFRGMSDDVENNAMIMYNGADIDTEDFATSTLTTLITSIPYADMSDAIGLTADKIVTGNTILGVEGTANTTSIKITDARRLFQDGARLDYMNELLGLCENIINTEYMFYYCTHLTSLNLNLDTSNVTTMSHMFYNCQSLESLVVSNFDTSNVTNMDNTFSSCRKLTDLDLSNFDMGKVTNATNVLYDMLALTNLKSFKNLGKAYTRTIENYTQYKFDISKSTNLTHESLMDVINNLYDLNLSYDVANGGTLYRQALVLGSTNLAKLTEEEIAIATNKGWDVT